MEQRTDNWLNWRKRGIGGSDAPIIMGVSPWKTAYQLWEEKTDRVKPDQVSNFAQEKGNTLEPPARAKYELEMGFEMGAATCAHHQHDFMRASMDGWNPNCPPVPAHIHMKNGVKVFENPGFKTPHKRGLEIKCPGRDDHEMACHGEVPNKYLYQLYHQFIVTGADVIDYYSYYLSKEDYLAGNHSHGHGVRVEVHRPDIKLLIAYFKKAEAFWKCVTTNTPPELSDSDYKLIRSVEMKKLCESWKIAKKAAKQLDLEIDELERKMMECAGADVPRWRVEKTGVKMITVERQGNVNWKAIPELQGVDVEKYRGKGSKYPKFSVEAPSEDHEAPAV